MNIYILIGLNNIQKIQIMSYTIEGLRYEKGMVTKVTQHDYDFVYTDVEEDIPHVVLKTEDGSFYELKLYTDEGECGSGYSTASYGVRELEAVSAPKVDYRPIHDSPKDLCVCFSEDEKFDCTYFHWDKYGHDAYYPDGYAGVYEDAFKKIIRTKSAKKAK